MQKKYNLDLPISSNNTSIVKLSTDLSNIKITDANLILKKTSGTGTISVSYYLNETTNWANADRLEISDNFQIYKINVTDKLQEIINNNLTEAQIKLVLNYGDSCAFETNVIAYLYGGEQVWQVN